MPFKISFNESLHIAELRFQHPADLKEHLDARHQIVDLCRKKKTNNVLVHLGDLIAQYSLSKMEQLEYSKSWSEEIFGKLRWAVVMPENVESQNEFYFIVYNSRLSGTNIQTFYVEDRATEWLCQDNAQDLTSFCA